MYGTNMKIKDSVIYQVMQCTVCNVAVRRVRVTIVAVEKK